MPPLPTLRQLEYLVAVADHLSFHRAAAACQVSQPGLSAQIRELESTLGVPLFERDRRHVLVLPAGHQAVDRARRVLAEASGLVEAAHAFQRPLVGPLRLGVIPTISPYLLPTVLPRIRRRHPELRLALHEAPTADLVAALARGETDVLLLALEAPLEGLVTHPLFEDAFVVALPRGHRLAARKRLDESDLDGEAVLLLADAHCLRTQALAVCRSGRIDERADMRATSLSTLVQMVAGGAGLTVLPELTLSVEGKRADLAIVRFAPPVPHRTIGLAWRATSGRAAEFKVLAASLVGSKPA